MPFVIALEGRVQSIGVNEKDDSGDGNKNAESVQPGKGRLHRFSGQCLGMEKRVVIRVVDLICKPNRVKIPMRAQGPDNF
jgi:hypothetical protein